MSGKGRYAITKNPLCRHKPAGRMEWPTGIPEPGQPHASTHVCAREACQADASEWVEAHTGHAGEFVPFPA